MELENRGEDPAEGECRREHDHQPEDELNREPAVGPGMEREVDLGKEPGQYLEEIGGSVGQRSSAGEQQGEQYCRIGGGAPAQVSGEIGAAQSEADEEGEQHQ